MYKLNIVGYSIAVLGRIGVMIAGYMGNVPLMLVFTGVGALGTLVLCLLNVEKANAKLLEAKN